MTNLRTASYVPGRAWTWSGSAWLDWLAGHPFAWHSFAILEDLVMSIGYVPLDHDELDEHIDALEVALLGRALALLRLNLLKNKADALAVCERYPDGMLGAMIYGRILALHLLGRQGDAAAALAVANKGSPRIAKMLIAKKPRMPELQPGLVTFGGADEAWYYRQSWRGVWERSGALDWLRRAIEVKA